MSKASEWAKEYAKRPEGFDPRGANFRAAVSECGRLQITVSGMQLASETTYLNHETALKLAHWIIDTFGEGAPDRRDGDE